MTITNQTQGRRLTKVMKGGEMTDEMRMVKLRNFGSGGYSRHDKWSVQTKSYVGNADTYL